MVSQREGIRLGASGFDQYLEEEEIRVILDIFVYLWNNYGKHSRRDHFSASRATKMIFLVDWYYAQHNKDNWKQATAIPWLYNVYGPYVNLIPIVKRKFKVVQDRDKTLFELGKEEVDTLDSLSGKIKEIIDMVIKDTQALTYFGFINYVYETPAVELSEKGKRIEISQIAREIAGAQIQLF